MSIAKKDQLRILLKRHIERIERKIGFLQEWSTRFSYIRLTFFVAGILTLYFLAGAVNDFIYGLLIFGFTGIFIWMISHHRKITNALEEFNFLIKIKQEHIARMDLDWNHIPDYSFDKKLNDHPFGGDLDIVGPKSLHHLIDTSIYDGGKQILGDWLLESNPDVGAIQKRRKLVKELTPLMVFRDKLRVRAYITQTKTSDKDWSMSQLLKWLKEPRKQNFNRPLLVLALLSVTNIIMAALAVAGMIAPYVIVPFIIYLSYYNLNSDKVKGLYDAAYHMDLLLGRFSSILLHVEEFQFAKNSMLHTFCKDFKDSGTRPSQYLKKVSRLAGAASLQKNQVLWPLVNMVVPWDLYFSKKLEALKSELEPKLGIWLDTFYELEALNSLANFTALNPNYHFSESVNEDTDIKLEAVQLGHPLIPDHQKVSNDFNVSEKQNLFLITGSNMAGKSTFLRTVGINLCLNFAGAPVDASSFQSTPFRLFTSINVTDSLDEGFSHFYAEVRRLRILLNELQKENELPLFFFVDEIFRGTNNRERFIGSTAFLKKVAGTYGVGMVSTHDLELANLEDEIPQLSNWHFEETIEDGKMSFEYKLKDGPCRSTNALKIMEMEGLPV